jgi:hypothetical protein
MPALYTVQNPASELTDALDTYTLRCSMLITILNKTIAMHETDQPHRRLSEEQLCITMLGSQPGVCHWSHRLGRVPDRISLWGRRELRIDAQQTGCQAGRARRPLGGPPYPVVLSLRPASRSDVPPGRQSWSGAASSDPKTVPFPQIQVCFYFGSNDECRRYQLWFVYLSVIYLSKEALTWILINPDFRG